MTITVLDSTGATQTLDPPTQTTQAAILAKLSSDPATQTTLAAILAKLSADPASQTTLAAILAKIEAAPATAAKQDALAALIGEVQASPTSNTLLDRLKSIQTALASGVAVTGTFYQATQPVSLASVPLPAGAATAANQSTANTSLSSIDGKLTDVATQTTLAALNTKIPASPATAGNQTTGNTSLASIDAKIPAQGQALAAASMPVVLTAAQLSTLTPPAAISGFATSAKQDTQITAEQAILAKLIAAPATEAKQDTQITAEQAILAKLIAAPATEAKQDSAITLLGALTETAPASDTASSGLNGRLQRIAQRLSTLITALGSPFQAGGSIGNTSFGATQSGTWTVQPGNTANTTPWLMKTQRASNAPSQSSVAGSASSVSLLASNTSRLGATIYNDSSAILYLKLGATASTTSFTAILAGNSGGYGGYYEVPFGYTGAIDGIWTSATGNARITELT